MTPSFQEAAGGYRFYLYHRAETRPSRGSFLFLPPIAGEMNRCRHVVAQQARAFAQRGWDVLQFDLLGSGDSSGDFGDATWQSWLSDVDDAFTWLRERSGNEPCLWAMRGGCLLAADWLRTRMLKRPVLFWQPVLSGAQHLQHFLRMRLASGYLGKSGKNESPAELRERLAREGSIEIVGYRFSLGLTRGLQGTELAVLPAPTRVLWLEISAGTEPSLSPASVAGVERLRSLGCDVQARAVEGSAFWQIVEREEAPALLRETLALVERCP